MFGTAVYATIVAILTVLSFKRPPLALVGLLCMFGLEQLGQIYLPFLRTHGTFTNLYILILLIAALGLSFRSSQFTAGINFQQSKVAILSIALYLFALLSLTWTPVHAWSHWANIWPYLIANIIIAPILVAGIGDLEQVQKKFVWFGGVLVLFLATVPEWGTRSLIIVGTNDDLKLPLALAQMSGYLLVIGTMHFRKNYISMGWLTIVVVGALVVAIRTGSRGQLIFSVLSILLVTPLIWKRMTLKNILQLMATGALILSTSYYIFQTTGAFDSRWQSSAILSDTMDRLNMVKILLSEWISSPIAIIFGLGNSASFSDDVVGRYPHVVLLEVLGEEGFIGFIVFVAIILLSVRQAQRFSSLTFLSTDIKRVYAANYGCFIFTLLLALKQGSLLNSSDIFLFAVLGEKYFSLIKRELSRGVELTLRQTHLSLQHK